MKRPRRPAHPEWEARVQETGSSDKSMKWQATLMHNGAHYWNYFGRTREAALNAARGGRDDYVAAVARNTAAETVTL